MNRRPLKITTALLAAAAIALLVAGCAFVRPGSLTLSQPAGIGAVRVHFVLCTLGEPEGCGKNEEENVTVQYLAGIAVPPGSTPPQAFTATSTNGGAPITFTRNEEVAPEITASSASLQQLISEGGQKEKEEAEALKPLLGGPWPPPGLQGVGYLSAPVEEVKNKSPEWTVDADFGLPAAAQAGQPFAGPFGTGVAFGFRVVKAGQPANRAVHCLRFSKGSKANESEAFCTGSLLEGQLGSADLGVGAPAKAAQAFVGGSAELAYPLKFAGGGVLSFALSATSTAKGAKTKISPSKFTPGTPDASTHLSATGTGKVTVTVPKSVKPGTYKVTLTATAPQGGSVSGVGTFKVVKAKIKFGKVKLNSAKGLATLPVKVPGAGKLTISGKGIAKTSKKSKKAQSLKMKIKATGSALSKLKSAGSVKVKAKATFKPSSGISVSKTKTIVLKLG